LVSSSIAAIVQFTIAHFLCVVANRELNNGRAAMFAVIGIIAAELLTGKDGVEQLGLL
jgi:hypothetical protein